MTEATISGLETYTTWLPVASVTCALIRDAINALRLRIAAAPGLD